MKRIILLSVVSGLVLFGLIGSANAQIYCSGGYSGNYSYGGSGVYHGGFVGHVPPPVYRDRYTHGSTFEYYGRPRTQVVSHVRYHDNRTFRHHVFENVIDERVIHTGEYRRTRISGDVYTPSHRMARRMYHSE